MPGRGHSTEVEKCALLTFGTRTSTLTKESDTLRTGIPELLPAHAHTIRTRPHPVYVRVNPSWESHYYPFLQTPQPPPPSKRQYPPAQLAHAHDEPRDKRHYSDLNRLFRDELMLIGLWLW